MSWLIIACGALLAVGGAVSIVFGAPYMRIEFGWTEVIAGTTALAGGIVTIALGAVLHRLTALHKVMARTAPPASTPTTDAPFSLPAAMTSPAAPSRPTPPVADEPPPPLATPAEPRASRLSGLTGRFGAARKPPRSTDVPAVEPRIDVSPPVSPTPIPLSAEPMADPSFPVDAGADATHAEETVHVSEGEPFRRVGIADVAPREVVGHYEAGGASYVLFSDGTIEVETSTGTHRFASMEELKTFVERQDADKAGLGL